MSGLIFQLIFSYFLLSVWTERRNKKEPRTRSAVEQMGFPVSGCGTRGFAAQTVLARDDTEKPHLLPTSPAIVRPANTPPLVVADRQSGFNHELFFSDRFELVYNFVSVAEWRAKPAQTIATLLRKQSQRPLLREQYLSERAPSRCG